MKLGTRAWKAASSVVARTASGNASRGDDDDGLELDHLDGGDLNSRARSASRSAPAGLLEVTRSSEAATLGEMILGGGDRDGVALWSKEGGAWHEVFYAQFVCSARSIARGLIALSIEPGERVSILADTRPEWTLADAGSFCASARGRSWRRSIRPNSVTMAASRRVTT